MLRNLRTKPKKKVGSVSWKKQRALELIRNTFAELRMGILQHPDLTPSQAHFLCQQATIRERQEVAKVWDNTSFTTERYSNWK